MTVNVLCDRHHAGLYHSLELLGDRLGWDLWTPVGEEWYTQGYWSFGREHFGRECPRVELDPANEEALALFCFVAGDATRALAPAYFDAACGRLAGDERKRILLRVMATRQDVTIKQIQTERATAARASRREGA